MVTIRTAIRKHNRRHLVANSRRKARHLLKILLIGNHACGNRGDGAIARGLIEALEEELPAVAIVMTSRYPVSSAFLLGRPVEPDLFDKLKLGSGRVGSLARRALPYQ